MNLPLVTKDTLKSNEKRTRFTENALRIQILEKKRNRTTFLNPIKFS